MSACKYGHDEGRTKGGNCIVCTRDAKRKRMRELRRDPVFLAIDRARTSEYRKRPEVKLRHNERSAEYKARPEIRERENARERARGKKIQSTPEGRERRRAHRIKSRYSVTAKQYADLLAAQDGCCALCGATRYSKKIVNLAIDHDHESGRIRGLLCYRCNWTIGASGDTVESFAASPFATPLVLTYLRGPGGDLETLIAWYRRGGPRGPRLRQVG